MISLSSVKTLVKIVVTTSSTSIVASIVEPSSHASAIKASSASASLHSTSMVLLLVVLALELPWLLESSSCALLIAVLPLLRLLSHI
jgi:hypothetical protein